MSYNSKYTGKEVDEALGLAKTALQEHQDLSGLLSKDEAGKTYAKIDYVTQLVGGINAVLDDINGEEV